MQQQRQETSVALALFRGVYPNWQKMPPVLRVWQQDNLHGVAWRRGAQTLELLVNVSSLREQRLETGARLWHDTVDVECVLVHDEELDLTRADDAQKLSALCHAFLQ